MKHWIVSAAWMIPGPFAAPAAFILRRAIMAKIHGIWLLAAMLAGAVGQANAANIVADLGL